MTSININVGDAFLLETSNIPHLYVVIASTTNNKYLFVNLTTRRARSETTCILQPNTAGMPKYVKSESVIAYEFARELDANQLAIDICEGSPIPKCTFPPDILDKIQQGAITSNLIEPRHKRSIKNFLGIP